MEYTNRIVHWGTLAKCHNKLTYLLNKIRQRIFMKYFYSGCKKKIQFWYKLQYEQNGTHVNITDFHLTMITVSHHHRLLESHRHSRMSSPAQSSQIPTLHGIHRHHPKWYIRIDCRCSEEKTRAIFYGIILKRIICVRFYLPICFTSRLSRYFIYKFST